MGRLISSRVFFKGLGQLMLTLLLLQTYGCGGHKKEPGAYCNELISLMNLNEAQISIMNQAMGAADFACAETVRINWEDLLAEALKKVKAIGDYNGDDQLQLAVISSLHAYQGIVRGPYKSLIGLRSRADPASAANEQALITKINQGFMEAGNAINRSLYAFQQVYAQGH